MKNFVSFGAVYTRGLVLDNKINQIKYKLNEKEHLMG